MKKAKAGLKGQTFLPLRSQGQTFAPLRSDLSSFRAMLRDAGYKATPIRLKLLSILADAGKPISVEGIWRAAGKRKADQATMYRAVGDFMKSGILRRIDVGHAHAHYELAGSHHHHLICTLCGNMEDISDCNIKEIARKTLKKTRLFRSVNMHTLELFGVCVRCSV